MGVLRGGVDERTKYHAWEGVRYKYISRASRKEYIGVQGHGGYRSWRVGLTPQEAVRCRTTNMNFIPTLSTSHHLLWLSHSRVRSCTTAAQ